MHIWVFMVMYVMVVFQRLFNVKKNPQFEKLKMDIRMVRNVMFQLLRGVDFLHSNGAKHTDRETDTETKKRGRG
jgi:serine/threonine protein kinase